MKFDKFLKIIWLINGIIILMFLVGFGVVALGELLRSFSYTPPNVIVGEELQQAKEKGLVLQALDFAEPRGIRGSSGYLLPVAVKTYDTPADMKDSESFQDVVYDKKVGLGLASRSYYEYSAPTLNVVFLNSRLEPTRTLLDKKGFIEEFRYPEKQDQYPTGDSLVLKYITYEIGYEDSNKDGVMNSDDKTDLYFTDLEGKNLTQITHNVDVHRYYFFNEDELIIIYARRSDKPEEYKKEHFARYDFRTRKLDDLKALHETLDQLEKTLIQ